MILGEMLHVDWGAVLFCCSVSGDDGDGGGDGGDDGGGDDDGN